MRRKILDFTQSYISLGRKFYVYAITNSEIEKTKNMVWSVAVPAVECSRITFPLKPSMAKWKHKTVQNSGLGPAWLCRWQISWNVSWNVWGPLGSWSKEAKASLSYHLEQQLSGSQVNRLVRPGSKTEVEVKFSAHPLSCIWISSGAQLEYLFTKKRRQQG